MPKEVLVCLEGSASTASATSLAIELARRHGFTLVGIAIVDEPDIRAGTPLGIGGSAFKRERDDTLMADAHERAARWLQTFEARCGNEAIPSRSLEVTGRPAASIVAEMSKHDLTVIGQDANFRFETDENDAETRDAVLHKTHKPMILVPETVSSVGNVVLIAYDGSGAAKRALSSFAESGLANGRDVRVVTVDDNGAEAWEMANRAVGMLNQQGIGATPVAVVSPLSNADALLETVEKLSAGLLVMGAFAHTRWATLFGRTVTRSLLGKAPIPLFLQH